MGVDSFKLNTGNAGSFAQGAAVNKDKSGALNGAGTRPDAAFTAQKGDAFRAKLSTRQRFSQFLTRVVAVKTGLVPRALRSRVYSARDNQRCINNLLGNLARVDDSKAYRSIALAAVELAERSGGELTTLRGIESLRSSLDAQKLRSVNTKLNDSKAEEVLKHVHPTQREQVAAVLKQVREQVREQVRGQEREQVRERLNGFKPLYRERLADIRTRLPEELAAVGTPERQEQLRAVKEALQSISFSEVWRGDGAWQLRADMNAIVTNGEDGKDWVNKLSNASKILRGQDNVESSQEKSMLAMLERLAMYIPVEHIPVDLSAEK
ncbi:hypothetical protein ACTPOE_10975 [Castellaniella sp. WN]